jgi:hypothetical protein
MQNFILGIAVAMLLSFGLTYEVNNSTAEVKERDGVYVFQECLPVQDYERLGDYKIYFSFKSSNDGLLDQHLKNCKDKFPSATGLIISESRSTGVAIRFKN